MDERKTNEMMIKKINLVYFSATGTTAKIVSAIADGLQTAQMVRLEQGEPTVHGELQEEGQVKADQGKAAPQRVVCNLLAGAEKGEVRINRDEVAVIGVPVFSGRVPPAAKLALSGIRGDNTPAVVVCVYGNRDFDDALIELCDIAKENGFCVVAAGAFVAQHSIFPEIAKGRPDTSDLEQAKQFGAASEANLNALSADNQSTIARTCAHDATDAASANVNNPANVNHNEIKVKGNRPYRQVNKIPIKPRTTKACNNCAICANTCPAKAINPQNPKQLDADKCISCAHCIAICPEGAKHFGGIVYRLASRKFAKICAVRCEPYIVYR